MIVQVTTDNKNRAASTLRSIFTKFGGNLAGAGAVAFQFQHLGQFLVAREKANEDALMELALETGADDVLTTEQGYEIRCPVKAFDTVSHALEKKGIKPDNAEIAYIPSSHAPSPTSAPPGRWRNSTTRSRRTTTSKTFFPTRKWTTRSARPRRRSKFRVPSWF